MAAPEQTADYLLDRRKLRRKLSFWRVAAFAFLVVAAGAITWRLTGGSGPSTLQSHIARITIDGIITGDRDTLKLIDDVAKSHAAGVILSIESPGGTTTGASSCAASARAPDDRPRLGPHTKRQATRSHV